MFATAYTVYGASLLGYAVWAGLSRLSRRRRRPVRAARAAGRHRRRLAAAGRDPRRRRGRRRRRHAARRRRRDRPAASDPLRSRSAPHRPCAYRNAVPHPTILATSGGVRPSDRLQWEVGPLTHQAVCARWRHRPGASGLLRAHRLGRRPSARPRRSTTTPGGTAGRRATSPCSPCPTSRTSTSTCSTRTSSGSGSEAWPGCCRWWRLHGVDTAMAGGLGGGRRAHRHLRRIPRSARRREHRPLGPSLRPLTNGLAFLPDSTGSTTTASPGAGPAAPADRRWHPSARLRHRRRCRAPLPRHGAARCADRRDGARAYAVEAGADGTARETPLPARLLGVEGQPAANMPLTSACHVTGPTIPSTATDVDVDRQRLLDARTAGLGHRTEHAVDLRTLAPDPRRGCGTGTPPGPRAQRHPGCRAAP